MIGLLALLALAVTAPAAIIGSAAGADTCGSALALWRSPGAPGPRLWHPIAPWRERGRR